MNIKNWLAKHYYFNKQERRGLLVLVVFFCVLFIFKMCIPYIFNSQRVILLNQPKAYKGEQDTVLKHTLQFKKSIDNNNTNLNLFTFNPNTITLEIALQLGISKRLFYTIEKYRLKGGTFFKAEDFKKVYGLHPKLYEKLLPYILIPQLKRDSSNSHFYTKLKKPSVLTPIELNSADSLQILKIKGIGPVYAKRICKYKQLLGGFYSLNQLKEVYGMSDSLFLKIESQITVNSNLITQIEINKIDIYTLKKHPYFRQVNLKAISNYISKHERISQVQLQSLNLFDYETFEKLLPYLRF